MDFALEYEREHNLHIRAERLLERMRRIKATIIENKRHTEEFIQPMDAEEQTTAHMHEPLALEHLDVVETFGSVEEEKSTVQQQSDEEIAASLDIDSILGDIQALEL